MIFLTPSSISIASFVTYIGALIIARIALLFAILYLFYISSIRLSAVFFRPYSTCAYMAPMIRFLAMLGDMPFPFSMKGTSFRLICSAFSSCLERCSSCYRSFWIILPRYLYEFTFFRFFPWYHSSPDSCVMNSVFSVLSSMPNLLSIDSSSVRLICILAMLVSVIAISSANASIPTYSSPKHIPLLFLMNSWIIFWITKLNRIGLVEAPCFTPF